MTIVSKCAICGKQIIRGGSRKGRFCSLACKGKWQHLQIPVDGAWLRQKYITERMSTYQIARIVHRDPKSVYNWLKQEGIPTRSRGETLSENAYGRLMHLGVVPIPFKGEHHTMETRAILSKKASVPKPYLRGEGNGMFGRRGALSPNWKGGSTPERQSFYGSIEWRRVAKAIWKASEGRCRRCGIEYPYAKFHIHHIVPFGVKKLRCEPMNLVVLCENCHQFVHSKKNTKKEWIARDMKELLAIAEEVVQNGG